MKQNQLKTIKEKLYKLEYLLKKKFKVKKIGIFGSYLKGEQKKGSDLDLLVEFSEPIGLFDFIGLEDFLTQKLEVKVDLIMKDALKLRIKDRILRDVVYV